ncbi:MAG TPA: hypothetical protein VLO11_10880 [Luteolibacter sp.]|nr:hypothetical protein [Luteolibacter sp.]
MKRIFSIIALSCAAAVCATGQVRIDHEAFGKSLGGWDKRGNSAAQYPLSGSTYRTFRPETTPTPDGGIFVSVRIDHVRGIFSSDDHATLEVTIDSNGGIQSARSNIAIQGRSISSDVILGTTKAGQVVGGVDRAVQIGTDLVANLSAKLLREKVVESGRVTFPAAVRHNYNLLYQAIRVDVPQVADAAEKTAVGTEVPAETPESTPPEEAAETTDPSHANLDIHPYATPGKLDPQKGN